MSAESERGCGFRQPGGLYLVSGGPSVICDRLPVPIVPCACCGYVPPQTRGFAWVSGRWLGDHRKYTVRANPNVLTRCFDAVAPWGENFVGGRDPICLSSEEPRLLLWVGKRYYSPESFAEESDRLGVSKRIPEIPDGLILGKTWAFLAHPEACVEPVSAGFRWLFGDGVVYPAPGVFQAFVPQRVELILHESEATAERVAKEAARGVSVVIIPDGAADARVSWRPGEPRPETPTAIPAAPQEVGA